MTRVLLDRGHSVTVVENDPDAVEALKAMGVQVLAADLNEVGWSEQLRGQRFDAILACDVLEHLHEPEVTLKALRDLAAPAARIVISMPNVAYGGLVAGLQLGQFEYAATGLLDRTHVRFFTRNSLVKTLMLCGWAPEHWEGYHVPIEQSEFVWNWKQLSNLQRQALMSGSADFDVYEWMAVATPMKDAYAARVGAADKEIARLKGELQELSLRHDQEHDSLIEHQKAFSEARALIAEQQQTIREHEETAVELQVRQEILVSDLTKRDNQWQAEVELLQQELASLKLQGWPGRIRRLLDALRK
jgi:SAM-dependent methyltransferase